MVGSTGGQMEMKYWSCSWLEQQCEEHRLNHRDACCCEAMRKSAEQQEGYCGRWGNSWSHRCWVAKIMWRVCSSVATGNRLLVAMKQSWTCLAPKIQSMLTRFVFPRPVPRDVNLDNRQQWLQVSNSQGGLEVLGQQEVERILPQSKPRSYRSVGDQWHSMPFSY